MTFGQKKLDGKYSNHFGEKIELKSDSTFLYSWNFDLASSWSTGKWKLDNNTIFLNVIPIMDTLKIVNNNKYSDSLILSSDQKGSLIKKEETLIKALSGGGKNRQKPPKKLYFRNGNLFRLTDNNEIDNKKYKQLSTDKKFKTFFYKTD